MDLYLRKVFLMKMALSLVAGLLFAQTPDVPTGAARSILVLDKPAQAAPRDDSSPARLVPVHLPAGGPPPREILREMLASPKTDALGGKPVTLLDVLVAVRVRSRQATLIDAYWNLSAAVANYHIALDEQRQLELISPAKENDRALLDTALDEARVGVLVARLAAVEAQHRLAAQRPITAGDALPLPADPPHVGAYRTRFETIFLNRPAPQARRLDDTLPIQHDAIRARARAATSTAKLLSLRLESYSAGRVDLAQVLAVGERLYQQRRRFIADVRQYNHRIAECAGIVAPEGTDGARLVAMLIHLDPSKEQPPGRPADGLRSVLIQRSPKLVRPPSETNSGVVQASGQEPIEPSKALSPSEATTEPPKPRDGFVPRRTPLKP